MPGSAYLLCYSSSLYGATRVMMISRRWVGGVWKPIRHGAHSLKQTLNVLANRRDTETPHTELPLPVFTSLEKHLN
ncbi:hypothetical protein QQF64_035508 [Cirrhinus molitorella]|uniref:Secreted protein n=1 Tax=Cirrhinus molitorella TaxID=172907 RepID=A0ABR3NG04_9TELE